MQFVDRNDLDGVAADPEGATGKGQVVACVLNVDEVTQQVLAVDVVADLKFHHSIDVLRGCSQTVDRRHCRYDDNVASRQKAVGRRIAESLDLVVDRRVLLDVGVGLRDVRLWLVVVVVRHEVLDGVARQQLAELVRKLRGQRLVGSHDEGRSLEFLDEPGGGRRLAGAGSPQQHYVLLPRPQPLGKLCDRSGLIPARLELRLDLER